VGAQIPVGVGLAFALKYQSKKNVTAIMFGDGAANQGQLFEAANMAKLMNLPALFICENNIYGMGTSIERSSMNPLFYTRGDKIPGIRTDGNNIFAVREVMRFAKNYAMEKGPLFIEFMTYRYSGHSMSDPGTTYRSRDEVQSHRKTTDPIIKLGLIALENKLATAEEFEVPSSPNRRNWTKKPKITCTIRSRRPRKTPKSV
jgi:pyruvate dehydrogenase E1 component alpha subunit